MDLYLMGEKIKNARMEKKLTLEKLSERIGISRNFLWEIEAGRKAPAIQTLYGISRELGISVDYIFGLSTDKKWIEVNTQDNITLNLSEIILKLSTKEQKTLYNLIDVYIHNKTM